MRFSHVFFSRGFQNERQQKKNVTNVCEHTPRSSLRRRQHRTLQITLTAAANTSDIHKRRAANNLHAVCCGSGFNCAAEVYWEPIIIIMREGDSRVLRISCGGLKCVTTRNISCQVEPGLASGPALHVRTYVARSVARVEVRAN